MAPRSWLVLGITAALCTSTSPGRAHIDLKSPPARAPGRPDTYLRREPCGQIDNARDPQRVSTFEPGQEIVVEWDVYQQHVSYFRVAIDLDGDDSFSKRTSQPSDAASDDLARLQPNPGERILAYVEDDAAQLEHVAEMVTLPDEECERCTLQVIQFTYGLPLREAYYYQCADLVLRRSGRAEAPAAVDAGTSRPDPQATAADPLDRESGCAVAARRPEPDSTSGPLPWPALGVLALALGALGRRRAGRQGSSTRHNGL
jgi:hypothetical protein